MRGRYRAAVLGAGMAALAASSPALAQGPEAADIAFCLCVRQALDALSGHLAAGQQSYSTVQEELNRLDAEMAAARATIDVNNPASVAHFRQLLEMRDAAFRRSTSLVAGDLSRMTEHYNTQVAEYNARCANRPRDPALVASVQSRLSCPPPY